MSNINCHATEAYYGRFLPSFGLYRFTDVKEGFVTYGGKVPLVEGAWGLTHSNDPSFLFDIDPIRDLTYEMTEEEEEKYLNGLGDEGFSRQSKIIDHYVDRMVGDANECHLLVAEAIEEGYNQDDHGSIGVWVMDRMRRIIDERPEPESLSIRLGLEVLKKAKPIEEVFPFLKLTHFYVECLEGSVKILVKGRRYRIKNGQIPNEDWKTALAHKQEPLKEGDEFTFLDRLDNMYGRYYKIRNDDHGFYYASMAFVELEEIE